MVEKPRRLSVIRDGVLEPTPEAGAETFRDPEKVAAAAPGWKRHGAFEMRAASERARSCEFVWGRLVPALEETNDRLR